MDFLNRLWEPSDRRLLARTNRLERDLRPLPDDRLPERMAGLRQRLAGGAGVLELLPEAFACAREACRRATGLRPFDVQVLGGIELARGRIVEMATGEGKTLAAVLPAALHALAGRGVHVVTVNDYLAARDAAWMGPAYRLLGLSVGCVQERMGGDETEARQAAYACDVTYVTNAELVFDCLRDNLAGSADEIVQRGYHYAIVDEVDLLLIDEAQTPLIISGPGEDEMRLFPTADRAVRRLAAGRHYTVEHKSRTAALTEAGLSAIETSLGVGGLTEAANLPWTHAIHQSLQAHAVFQRDVDYIVEQGQVRLVDEHTGRVSPDKRFSNGLHQALEAKERLRVRAEDRTLARTSYQHFFRGYRLLSGMTGTAWSEREELGRIYGLKVRRIPPNRPVIRTDHRRIVFRTEAGKHRAVADEIAEQRAGGRPVLVGTLSVGESERLSLLLRRLGIPHEVLNARNHAAEAAIVAQAGREGAVTISTAMAGRGTDIVLGGNPEGLAALDAAPSTPARAEALERRRRECAEEQRRVVAAGGLHVIGTGEHESERIDRQLRGRAGRQGDPGSSIFCVSLDDPVYRKFGQKRLLPEMAALLAGWPEDEPVVRPDIGRALDLLRDKVAEENFAIRIDVFKYDAIIHERREAIWNWRRELLSGSSPEEWQRSALELAEDLVPRLAEEAGRLAEGPPRPDEVWQAAALLLAAGIAGMAPIGRVIDSRQALSEWIAERYRSRYGSPTDDRLREWERRLLLGTIDRLWTDFLSNAERIEEGIGLRGYGNLEPLVEFRREIGLLYGRLMLDIGLSTVRAWLSVGPPQLAGGGGEIRPRRDRGRPLRR